MRELGEIRMRDPEEYEFMEQAYLEKLRRMRAAQEAVSP